jgi:hypothetical protein
MVMAMGMLCVVAVRLISFHSTWIP